ncbi:hypothetical protein Pse7367_2172 [Thalassoporum mexicanum PCC 7367]|uniref:hypothetical protein n=1 Tax=Thalassoporum mexicanum TaxID=3457544 RepID=UPI00029FFD17|nr:hypothetical protein [Pseudanabaena sp. PCC 7367]AFY70436.1 hypothetical protein Pse7367_2172 [Pseudanabaena sp. PCC 7367]
MSDTSRQKLREIIATYGSNIVDDPRRLKALLKDLCGEYKLEINLLTFAAEQRVPELLTLTEVWDSQDSYIHSLCDRLQSAQPMSMRSAIWAVRSWMYALGLSNSGSHESLLGNGTNNGGTNVTNGTRATFNRDNGSNGDHHLGNGRNSNGNNGKVATIAMSASANDLASDNNSDNNEVNQLLAEPQEHPPSLPDNPAQSQSVRSDGTDRPDPGDRLNSINSINSTNSNHANQSDQSDRPIALTGEPNLNNFNHRTDPTEQGIDADRLIEQIEQFDQLAEAQSTQANSSTSNQDLDQASANNPNNIEHINNVDQANTNNNNEIGSDGWSMAAAMMLANGMAGDRNGHKNNGNGNKDNQVSDQPEFADRSQVNAQVNDSNNSNDSGDVTQRQATPITSITESSPISLDHGALPPLPPNVKAPNIKAKANSRTTPPPKLKYRYKSKSKSKLQSSNSKARPKPTKQTNFALPTPMDLQSDRLPNRASSVQHPTEQRHQGAPNQNGVKPNRQPASRSPIPALPIFNPPEPTNRSEPPPPPQLDQIDQTNNTQDHPPQQLEVLSDADKRAKQEATVYLDGLFDDYELDLDNRRKQPEPIEPAPDALAAELNELNELDELDGLTKFRQRQHDYHQRDDRDQQAEPDSNSGTRRYQPLIALGIVGVGVVALTFGYGYNRARVAEQDLENVEMAAAHRSAGNYEACINQAQANAGNQAIALALQNVMQSCQSAQQDFLASQQLVLAQSLMDSGKLKEALTIAARISPNTDAYNESQQLIEQSSQRLLELAQAFYYKGQLEDAGKMIATIPETSELKGSALSSLALWQQEKQQNDLALVKAKRELSQGKWRGAIAAARQVTPVPHWQNQAQTVIKEAQSQIVAANQPSQPIAPAPVYNPPPAPRRNIYNPPAATYYEPAPRYNPPPRYSPPAPVYNPPPVVPAPSYDPAPPSRAD